MPHIKPIANVIDNNQPGWTNIVETQPHVTLDIGAELYLVEEPEEMKPDVYSWGKSCGSNVILKNGVRLDGVIDELNRLSAVRADYRRRLINIQKWST